MDLRSLLAGSLFGAVSSVLALSLFGPADHPLRSQPSSELDADLWDELEDLRSEVRQKSVTRISAQAQPRALSELAEQVESMQEQLLDLQERNDGLESLLSKVGTTVGVGAGGNRVDVDLRSLVLEDWELEALHRLSAADEAKAKALGLIPHPVNSRLVVERAALGAVVIDTFADGQQLESRVYQQVQLGGGMGTIQGQTEPAVLQNWFEPAGPTGR